MTWFAPNPRFPLSPYLIPILYPYFVVNIVECTLPELGEFIAYILQLLFLVVLVFSSSLDLKAQIGSAHDRQENFVRVANRRENK